MKKEVMLVPKDKCLLDMIAEMGERTKNAWFFLHTNVVEELQHSYGVSSEEGRTRGTLVLTFKATEEHSEKKVAINLAWSDVSWKPITYISDLYLIPVDFEDIYFFQMAE